jgi:tetratricopeptide (TPR) repeat protein
MVFICYNAPMPRKRNIFRNVFVFLAVLLVLAVLVYQIPTVKDRLAWRRERLLAYWNGVIHPAQAMPTPLPQPSLTLPAATATATTPTATPTPVTPTATQPGPTETAIPTPTPLPEAVSLPAPAWEKQDINNCGPAALTMYLRMYGWSGDQFAVSDVIKPVREDRNVNPEELIYWVRNYAGWLNAEFRVGGDIDLLKHLLAVGIPVMIEESFHFEEPYWPNDDLWAAHYQLLTGYDDATHTFTGQDSYYGADQSIPYDVLDENWRIFNRVYILVYPPAMEETVKSLLGPAWEMDASRQRALEVSQAEIEKNPQDAYAWFNLGSNQVYFEQYAEAAHSYDEARKLGLPQRMLRYQFGPFFAYFHAFRNDDLLALAEYALQRTPNSEEAMLWRGWGRYRDGDTLGAREDWENALQANPNFFDAQYALDYARSNP